jgi:hypothetical protein
MNTIDKLEQAVERIKKMDESDTLNGLATPQEVGQQEILGTALAALNAGITMMQDGRAEQAEGVLYEAAVYFMELGKTLETK